MSVQEKYKKAKRDYEYLVRHHGADIYDPSGGYEEGRAYKRLLANPSKAAAANHFINMIEYSASNGFSNYESGGGNGGSSPDFDDQKTLDIYRYYNCEYELSAAWGFDLDEG